MACCIKHKAVRVDAVQHHIGLGFVQNIDIFPESGQHQIVDLFRICVQGQGQLDLHAAQRAGMGHVAHHLGDELRVRDDDGGVIAHLDFGGAYIDAADVAFYRSEEHTSELQSLMRISYAVFCLKKKNSSTLNYRLLSALSRI